VPDYQHVMAVTRLNNFYSSSALSFLALAN
jgi:hypothetical protein